MGTLDVLRACIRRWYLVVPLLVITAWTSFAYYKSVTPVYYANTIVAAAPSNEQITFVPDGRPVKRNGLLDSGGTQLLMNLAVLGYDNPAVRQRVTAAGGMDSYKVRMFPNPPSTGPTAQLPLIMIEATEPDPASAVRTVALAASQADSVLREIQEKAGVDNSQMVRAIQVSEPQAIVGTPSRMKTVSVITIIGLGLSVLVGVSFDALINRLQKWRGKRRPSGLAGSDNSSSSRHSQSPAAAETAMNEHAAVS